jgi:hypothetical protein
MANGCATPDLQVRDAWTMSSGGLRGKAGQGKIEYERVVRMQGAKRGTQGNVCSGRAGAGSADRSDLECRANKGLHGACTERHGQSGIATHRR